MSQAARSVETPPSDNNSAASVARVLGAEDASKSALNGQAMVDISGAGDLAGSANPAGSAKRVWWVATGLLIIMAALFGLTVYLGLEAEWVRVLRAFSEAAMVGALADWFAVTALFRRPLGLPIPHTGIIPANKSRIGKSLGLFVQRNFLTEEVLDGQVVNISGTFARFLQSPANRQRIVDRVRAAVPHLLEVANDAEIKTFLNQQVEDLVRSADVARGGAKLLRALTANQMHEVVLDEVIHQLQAIFRNNQLWFRHQMREASPWFIPEFVDRKIFDAITNKTEETFQQALSNKNHDLRQRLLSSLYSFIIRLETSEELQKKSEELKQVILASDIFRGYISELRDTILAGIDTDVKKRDSVLLVALQKILQNTVDTLSTSPSLQRKLNRFIRSMLSSLVGKESTFVADLISKTIDGWDSKTLVAKLEEQVGADLQYIRINGTIVGGLVGLGLYAIGALIAR
jgi:uncharacterized membrane-anchored protein YjiN (DUF445 family)